MYLLLFLGLGVNDSVVGMTNCGSILGCLELLLVTLRTVGLEA
jgi:hypothetical protein